MKKFLFSWRGLALLFLTSAFPTHLWTIFLVLRDFSWVSTRTSVWSLVGVGAYGLLFAFVESVVIFGFLLLVSFLLPWRWEEKKRLVLLFIIMIVCSLWAICSQIFVASEIAVPAIIIQTLAFSSHPLRFLQASVGILVLFSILLPLYFTLKIEKIPGWLWGFLGRVALLAGFYLVLDFVGLVIVLIRNIRLA